MYALDRRLLATHVYNMLRSLRRTGIILQVSHTTVARWIKHHEPRTYDTSRRRRLSKATVVSESIRSAVVNDPFVSKHALQSLVLETFGFHVSRELIRTVILKNGFTRKKARFHGHPIHLEEKTVQFLEQRDQFIKQNKRFVSLDETSFGRKGGHTEYGHTTKGQPLCVKLKSKPRITTKSALVAVTSEGTLTYDVKDGSYDTSSFLQALDRFKIERDSVVLMDNVAFHHSKRVTKFAEERGIHVLFVPPYSPWFNPVEGVFSVVKRRYYSTRNVLGSLRHVTRAHIDAFFGHALRIRSGPATVKYV